MVCRRLELGEITTYDACLVIAELVINAVLHVRTAIELRVNGDVTGVRIEVEDRTPVLPELTRSRVAGDVVHAHGAACSWLKLSRRGSA